MRVFAGLVAGMASVLALLFLLEKALNSPISFSVGESEWLALPEVDDFVGGVLSKEVKYFPSSMENCKERRGPDYQGAFAEPTCAALLHGIGLKLSRKPNGLRIENFDEVISRIVTSSAHCYEIETGFICYRPLYFVKFRKDNFFSKPYVIADRSFFFTITLNHEEEAIVVDADWASSFTGPDDFPQLLPVGL